MNEQPPRESTDLEHELVERYEDDNTNDRYLESLRQQELDKKERDFELGRKRKADEQRSIDALKQEIEAASEQLEHEPAQKHAVMPTESTLATLGHRPRKDSALNQFGKRMRTFGVSLLFGAGSLLATKQSSATGLEDSLKKNDSIGKTVEAKTTHESKLTPQLMQEWNDFLDFVKEKGLEGSPKLDKDKSLGKQLLEEYRRLNPTVSFTYEMVALVQEEMEKLKESSQNFARRRNDPHAERIMNDISKVDGWFGSKTSQFRFPRMTEISYHNNALSSKHDLGLVDGELTPAVQRQIEQKLPKGLSMKNVEKLSDGYYYEDPQTGDLVKIR